MSELLASEVAVAKLKVPTICRVDRHANLAMGSHVNACRLSRWNPLSLHYDVAHCAKGHAADTDACRIDDGEPTTNISERNADVGCSAFNPDRHRARVDLYSLPLAEFDLNRERHFVLSLTGNIRIRMSAHVGGDGPRRWNVDQQRPMLRVELPLHKVDLSLRIITCLGKLPLHKLAVVPGISARLVRAGTGCANKRHCRRGKNKRYKRQYERRSGRQIRYRESSQRPVLYAIPMIG